MSTNRPTVASLAHDVAELRSEIAPLTVAVQALLAQFGAETPAVTPPAAAPVAAKPAPLYRSEKAKAKGREAAADIWARHYAAAGVKRFKDLTPAQQAAAKAEVNGAWKAVKGTRKTKA